VKIGYITEEGLENYNKNLEFLVWGEKHPNLTVAEIHYEVVIGKDKS